MFSADSRTSTTSSIVYVPKQAASYGLQLSYDSIGIGDKHPKEYAVLTVKDRMSLAVLQVRHSISIQTNTTHLPAPVRTLTRADG